MLTMVLLLTLVAAAYATLAVWAVTSRRHWFLRAAVYCAALALLMPIAAYEPLVLLGLTAAILAIGASAVRRFRPSDNSPDKSIRSWRFSVRDSLLAFVIAAFIALVIGVLVRERIQFSWWRASMAASILAIMAALATCVSRGPRRWLALLGLAAAIPLAALVDAAVLGDWMTLDGLFLNSRNSAPIQVLMPGISVLYAVLAIWLLLFGAFASSLSSNADARKSLTVWRAATLLLVAPLLAGLGWIYWRMLASPVVEADVVSGENVYPQILEIASDLEGATPQHAAEIYAQVLPLLSRPGHAVLDWQGPCREPIKRLEAYEQRKMKVLAWTLNSESGRCRASGQPEEAAKFAEAALQLVRMAARGGIMADSMAADSDRPCLREIAHVRSEISPTTAKRLSKLIEKLENEREAPTLIFAREADYRFLTERRRYRLLHVVWVDMFAFEMVPDPYDSLVEPWSNEFACFARMLSLDLALRAYRADRGTWPKELPELAPGYLDDVPTDPLSGQPFVYRPTEPEFVLYSLGTDEHDDGGRFSNIIQLSRTRKDNVGIDLDVDTLTRP